MTGKPRDNQRARVYAAEGHTWTQTIANDDLQAWVNAVMRKAAVTSRWGTRHIDVYLTHGGAHGGGNAIHLGVQTRNPRVMLHEIAHCLTPSKYAAHGPEFVGVLLFLYRTVLGKAEADRQRAAFRAGRVRISNKAVPAVNPAHVRARAAAKVRHRESAKAPITAIEARVSAATIRRAATQGLLGAVGSKQRTYALATARTLDAVR